MEKLNYKKIASTCKTFAEYRLKLELLKKLDRLQREPKRIEHHTKKKNLKELASSSMTFSDFHQKTQEGE